MNSIFQLINPERTAQAKNVAQHKRAIELASNVDDNPIARLKQIRDTKAALAAEEERIREKLKEKAPRFGFREDEKTILLRIGEWGAKIRTVTSSFIDEEKVYAYCKQHGLRTPKRKVISFEFDEEAYNSLAIPSSIREKFVTDKSYQTITPYKEKTKR